jgi:SNARE protein
MDKIKDSSRQSKQLEDLTAKMRECKRYVCLNSAPCFLS